MKLIDPEAVQLCRSAMLCENDYDDMSQIFDMFGDSTRLKIMSALFTHELCVSDLSALLEMSTSAVSHQLASLKKTKLVRTRKIGEASIICARRRPKFVGGSRAVYNEDLL